MMSILNFQFSRHEWIYAFVACLMGMLVFSGSCLAIDRELLRGSHANRGIMPKSCRSCHIGMAIGISGEERLCLNCHGEPSQREAMEARGLLRGNHNLANIEIELNKPFNHPVLTTAGVHFQDEILPELQIDTTRHSECVDCHNPHLLDKKNPFAGIKGKRVGNFTANVEFEYELCYRCHSDSANLPLSSTNKHSEFKPTNRSFHPVEAEGRNLYVISLKDPYVEKSEKPNDISRIGCRDCHGSDDPDGPQGPHGSIYRGLLVENYQMDDGLPESEFAYALCYKCHERASILGNESFPYHAAHIQGDGSAGIDGTSCMTCHDAHGSNNYQYLIRFNEDVVLPNADGKLAYETQGASSRSGSCLLNCHGVEHNPKSY